MRWAAAALVWTIAIVAQAPPEARLRQPASAGQAAYFVRSLDNPRQRHEAQSRILDTPVHPGSVVKPLALVAALEHGIVDAGTTHMCRRVATVGGRKFVCAHPDLKRPLSPAEALAYSCNDFFVSLAPKLSRDALNGVRLAAGLPPIASATPMADAILGVDGPRTTPRAFVDVLARVAGAGRDRPVPMKPATRDVLIAGLRGAADYGTASAFKDDGVSALAKTGSILMPNGTALGLVVALTPAGKPTHAVVVAAPGAAGLDAAAVASDVLRRRDALMSTDAPRLSGARPEAPANAVEKSSAGRFIRLGRTSGSSTRVEQIAIDEYIAQVLAGEGQPKASDAAQQALAITARTFAMANRNRHRAEGFDLCDTTHCQVVRPATAITTRAATATSGRVLLHQGQPAFVFYSAWCGGQTEIASQVWPGAIDYAREPSLEDDACEDEPAWTSEVRAGDIERALREAGHRGSRLRQLRVLSRNDSERVARLRIDGFTPNEISGHEFRMAVGRVAGWQSLKSTAFDVDRTGSGYRFRGRGFGHGVGLCVVGAGRRASRGASAEQILEFYFPGLTVGTVASAAAPVITPEPRRDNGLELALPAGEEGARAGLMNLIRNSRDEIAKLTGVKPLAIRVTVHPTVDSFGRATGQPWWVSGATNGAAIDLLPITVLRQQGQLERTIRHEMAHALLDGALAKKPMWVREGAAAYFANPSRTLAPDRVQCPADAELLRPISAGAQREAYARAEACFARAIADGKRWDQVP
jgi:SpoIID/LytB domain protein